MVRQRSTQPLFFGPPVRGEAVHHQNIPNIIVLLGQYLSIYLSTGPVSQKAGPGFPSRSEHLVFHARSVSMFDHVGQVFPSGTGCCRCGTSLIKILSLANIINTTKILSSSRQQGKWGSETADASPLSHRRSSCWMLSLALLLITSFHSGVQDGTRPEKGRS